MPKSLEQRIEDLKNTLETTEEFSLVFQQLMALSEDREFMNLSELAENELLDSMVKKVVEQVITSPHQKILSQWVFLEKFGLYHGTVLVGKRPAALVYFESLQMGMLTIPINPMGEVSYLRFTADIVMDGSFTGKAPSFQND